MQRLLQLVVALLALNLARCFSFTGVVARRSGLSMKFDVEKAAASLSNNKILTRTAQLGLLSRLEKSGFTLTTAIPLLKKADELDVLGYLEGSSDKLLPLIATAIDLAPAALPLVGATLKVGAPGLLLGAVASAGAAAVVLGLIPDDSVTNVALQTALAVPLGAIVPGACVVGAGVLSKLK